MNASFIVSEPRKLASNRMYKVYIRASGLYFAKVGGQLSDPATGKMVLAAVFMAFLASFVEGSVRAAVISLLLLIPLYILLDRFFKGRTKERGQMEKDYDQMDPENPGFVKADGDNFAITAVDIQLIRILENSLWAGLWQGASSHIEIVKADGSALKFILIGRPDLNILKKDLSVLTDGVEII